MLYTYINLSLERTRIIRTIIILCPCRVHTAIYIDRVHTPIYIAYISVWFPFEFPAHVCHKSLWLSTLRLPLYMHATFTDIKHSVYTADIREHLWLLLC